MFSSKIFSRSVQEFTLIVFFIVTCCTACGSGSSSSGDPLKLQSSSPDSHVVCDIISSRNFHSITGLSVWWYSYSHGSNNGGMLECTIFLDTTKNYRFSSLSMFYKCNQNEMSTVPEVKDLANKNNYTEVHEFTKTGLDGQGISYIAKKSYFVFWQYDDGCFLELSQSTNAGVGIDSVTDPTESLIKLLENIGTRVPDVAQGPSNEATIYPSGTTHDTKSS